MNAFVKHSQAPAQQQMKAMNKTARNAALLLLFIEKILRL